VSRDELSVSVIGAGRVGTAVAVLLARAGYKIAAVSGRDSTPARAARYLPGVPVMSAEEAARAGDVAIVGVPDDAIPSVSREIAGSLDGRWVSHLSGACRLDALDPAVVAGARPFLMHPLQTCPDVDRAILRIPGSAFAVTARDEEGAALGSRLAGAVGGRPFSLSDEKRALYHAAAVFASNYLVTDEAIAEGLFALAGVPDPLGAMLPLVRATVGNVEELGAGSALTGPAVRGDTGTIRRNLEALRQNEPSRIASYVEMARVALALAAGAGRISDERRRTVEEELDLWM
jgi:predicted short-subunit dehydrogenase-like oxidoreductase (DUF2520 family)